MAEQGAKWQDAEAHRMTTFEHLNEAGRRFGWEIDIFIGTGYARFAFAGLEFVEWVLVPWKVEELEEEIEGE